MMRRDFPTAIDLAHASHAVSRARGPLRRALPGLCVGAAALVMAAGALAVNAALADSAVDGVLTVGSPAFWRLFFWPAAVLTVVVVAQAILVWVLLRQRRFRQQSEREAERRRTDIAHAARLSLMGVLAASIAHEINQPLGAILSNADAAEMILDQENPDLDELRAIIRDIRNDDLRASDVIRGMRKLLRKREMRLAPLDVNAEVSAAIGHLASDAALRNVRIVQDLAAEVPRIAGDTVHLQQVLINLVVNAMEAMQAMPERDREVRIETRAARGGAEIAVKDNGPGISPDEAGRLFESFVTTKAEGTGLGLSIVRAIIDAHRGRVSADERSGPGAIFRVWLPAAAT